MVDRQRQTNQIVRAISVAAASICNTIESSTRKLAGAMQASFTLISNQISGLSGKMDKMIDITQKNAEDNQRMQKAQQEFMSAANEKIMQLQSAQLSATEMNNALLEKANRSSERLIADLRYVQKFWVK